MKTRAVILSNSLVLEYREGRERRALHLSLDLDDLRVLSRELERAYEKNQALLDESHEHGQVVLTLGSEGTY
jgi:hypothetical protein